MFKIWRKPWTIATIVTATALYVAACSDAFYELTSPSALEWHVLLRKAYSIVAFTLVGYLYRRARVEHGAKHVVLATVVAVAAYSAAIEVGQFFAGSKEGLAWNVFDTLCGAIGGLLATADRSVLHLRGRSRSTL
jgi:VanZ family protein